MKTALFHNISNKPFTGYWDGKPKTFKPGQQVMMPLYLAEHFAKHLTNAMLIQRGMHNFTSPKFPQQVPEFLSLFNQICIVDEEEEEKTEVDVEIDVANQQPVDKNVRNKKEPQIVLPPAEDDEDEGVGDAGGSDDENAEFNLKK